MVKLLQILDTSGIDVDNPNIRNCLIRDLISLKDLKHDKAPEGANAYYVSFKPNGVSMSGVSPFDIDIMYGLVEDDKF